jgi:hypothetical protein
MAEIRSTIAASPATKACDVTRTRSIQSILGDTAALSPARSRAFYRTYWRFS